MASYYVASELKDYAKFYMGSEDTEPGHGYDWSGINPLSGGKVADPVQYATAIAEKFYEYTTPWGHQAPKTQTITDNSKIPALETAFTAFLNFGREAALAQHGAVVKPMLAAQTEAWAIGGSFGETKAFLDLGDFITKFKAKVKTACPKATQLADAVLAAYTGTKKAEIGRAHV